MSKVWGGGCLEQRFLFARTPRKANCLRVSEPSTRPDTGASYRQSKRELFVMDRGMGGHGALGARLQFAGGVRGGNRDAGSDVVRPAALDGDWLVAAAVGGQRFHNLVLPALYAG